MENIIDADKLLNYMQTQSKTLDTLRIIVETLKENKGNIFILPPEHVSILNDLNLSSNSQTDIIKLNTKKTLKVPKFFSMIATNLQKLNTNFSFKKENDFSWGNLFYKKQLSYELMKDNAFQVYNKGNILLQKFKIDLKIKAQSYGVIVKEGNILNSVNKLVQTITLIGDKISINKLNKQFKNNLALIGFEAHELFQPTNKTFLNVTEVAENIDNKLSKNLNLQKIDDSYSFTILEGLTAERKFEMINKIIWPQLAKELGQSMGLAISLSDLLNKNKDLKSLLAFSKKNDMHTDIIIHSLKNNPEILKNYPGFENLKKDKDIILSSSEKYGILIQNNLVILKSLIKATTTLKNELLEIDDERAKNFITEINETPIASKVKSGTNEEIHYTLIKIEENILKTSISNKSKKSLTP